MIVQSPGIQSAHHVLTKTLWSIRCEQKQEDLRPEWFRQSFPGEENGWARQQMLHGGENAQNQLVTLLRSAALLGGSSKHCTLDFGICSLSSPSHSHCLCPAKMKGNGVKLTPHCLKCSIQVENKGVLWPSKFHSSPRELVCSCGTGKTACASQRNQLCLEDAPRNLLVCPVCLLKTFLLTLKNRMVFPFPFSSLLVWLIDLWLNGVAVYGFASVLVRGARRPLFPLTHCSPRSCCTNVISFGMTVTRFACIAA